MSLLTPLFLAGLAALALPVLLHLIDRADDDGRRFPSLMLVRRLPFRARRRRVLRDRALLALRCLALALLALAFARPFVADQGAAGAAPATDMVLLLDRSYSMATGERWSRATTAAAARLAGLGEDARVALVLFDDRPQTVVGLDDDRALVTAGIARATPGHAGTDYVGALEEAGAMLADSPAARRLVVLVTDLQRIGIAEGATVDLPAGVSIEAEAIAEPSPVNASLALLEARAGRDGGEGVLRLRVAREGELPAGGLTLVVEVDGRLVADRRVAAFEGEHSVLDIPLPAGSSRPLRVVARLAGDQLAIDDTLRLVLPPDTPLRVLLVLPDATRGARGVFVEGAMSVARAPRMVVRRIAASALDAEALADAELVVLDDAPLSGDAAWAALENRVRSGAGLLVSAGESLGAAWPRNAGWLPGRPGAVRESGPAGGLALRWHDRAHPLPATLGAGDADGPVDAAVRRYRAFETRDGDALVAVFDDDAPALLERRHGAGVVMVYTSTFDTRWGALAATPAFAPLLVQAARHLANRGPQVLAWRVGEVVDLARHAATLGAPALAAHLRAGGAALLRLPDGDSRSLADALLDTKQPGFHEVFAVGADLPALPLAVNVDTRESDAALLPLETLLTHVRVREESVGDTRAAAGRRLGETGADRAWWWLLLAVALLLVCESLLARRLSVRRGARERAGGAA